MGATVLGLPARGEEGVRLMARFTARHPRANPPICWVCDRQLYAGGRCYEIVVAEDGNEHPIHRACVGAAAAAGAITAQPARSGR
jgi:hypothetical protein